MKKLVSMVMCLGFVLSLCSNAIAVQSENFSWTGYARQNFQLGKDNAQGQPLWTGFGFHPRLQEVMYYEQYLTAKLEKDTKFVLTLAQTGDSFNYNGTWGTALAVRELYLQMDNVADKDGVTLWFGNKMFRGNDIFLFDAWPLDNVNINGGGVKFGSDLECEFAMGAKLDIGYQGVTNSNNAQRLILANKLVKKLNDKRSLKSSIEYQTVNKTIGMYGVTPVDVPAASGLRVGLQHTLNTKGGVNHIMLSYAKGDIAPDFFSTPDVNVATLNTTAGGTLAVTGVTERKDSTATLIGTGGFEEMGQWGMHYGVMSLTEQNEANNNSVKGQQTIVAVRPLYYVTERFNIGCEFDSVAYGSKLTAADIDYFQIAPMIEYQLKGKLWGWPKFKVIFANTTYKEDCLKYGELVKSAMNLSIGMELVW